MIYVAPISEDVSRILFAIAKVESRVELEKNDLPFRSAVDFQHLVIANLNSQKYAGGYAPYSDMYKKWKQEQGVGMKYWELYGDLVESIKVFKLGKGWMSGVIPGKVASRSSQMYGKKKKRVLISYYARLMESTRPLFTPTKDEYRKDGFPKRGRESLNKIKWSWS